MPELKDGCPEDFGDGERCMINSMVNSKESQIEFAPLALSNPHSDSDREMMSITELVNEAELVDGKPSQSQPTYMICT